MNIYEKINAVRMALLKSEIVKDKIGTNNDYRYIDLPQIEGIITEECDKVRLLTLVSFPDGQATITAIDLDNPVPLPDLMDVLGRTNSVSSVMLTVPCDSSMVDIKGSQAIQKVGGMMTYMRRYLYMTMFAISEHDAVEGIGKLSQETANAKDGMKKEKSNSTEDQRRAEIIGKFQKTMPNYLKQLVTYKSVKSVDDFSTDYLEKVYNKKTKGKKTADSETTV